MSKPPREQILDAMVPWMDGIRAYPGFSDWKRKAIARIIDYGERTSIEEKKPSEKEFKFPPDIERQHAAMMSYLSLSVTHNAMAATEFYFRRYPFQSLPVTREEHLRYTCETFFSRIYEFSERMKRCLNNLNEVIDGQVNVGGIIKEFATDFKQELIARNQIHHHERFDEIQLNKVGWLENVANSDKRQDKDRGWMTETRIAYRRASLEWAARAKRRSERAGIYLDAVAKAYLDYATFLHPSERES